MGASTSSEKAPVEKQEVEALASSTGSLLMLQSSFSKLSVRNTQIIPFASLQKCFHLTLKNSISEAPMMPEHFRVLVDQLGVSIVDLFFGAEKGGFSWVEFLKGYVKCCGRKPASMSLKNLLRVYATSASKAGLPSNLHIEFVEDDCKITGLLLPAELHMLLLMSWVMLGSSRILASSSIKTGRTLPVMDHLILSAVSWCTEVASNFDAWECNISGMEINLSAEKIQTWAFNTVPCLADCLARFVHAGLQYCTTLEEGLDPSSLSVGDNSSRKSCDTHLLTCGRAWAVSLTTGSTEEIIRVSFPSNGVGIDDNILYRSSLHGKGLNRLWSKIEGYHGSILMLISARSVDSSDGSNDRKWIIGALTQQSFENQDTFYGSSGNLYAFSPVFHAISPSGKEKNFVYSHLRPSSRTYESHPKPVGIAFGGSIGNERIFLGEDFDKLTIRHHAVDKTYGPGSLIPNQGFLPLEGLVSEVEVWGLGGRKAKEVQSGYKQREQLFMEQRRKVDLKTFLSWEDSPEKMMMDMISDPNHARSEVRK